MGYNAKLHIFNDVKKIISALDVIGIGQLDKWLKKGDLYLTSTPLFYFDGANKGHTQNSLYILLSGEAYSIHKISVQLNIGAKQDKAEAINVYKNVLIKIFTSLNIHIPDNLINSLLNRSDFKFGYLTHCIDMQFRECGMITCCDVFITSELHRTT